MPPLKVGQDTEHGTLDAMRDSVQQRNNVKIIQHNHAMDVDVRFRIIVLVNFFLACVDTLVESLRSIGKGVLPNLSPTAMMD